MIFFNQGIIIIVVVVVLLSKQAIRNANDVSTAPRSFSSSGSWIRNSACIQISETMKSKKLSIYIRTIKITECENEVKIGSEKNEKYYKC